MSEEAEVESEAVEQEVDDGTKEGSGQEAVSQEDLDRAIRMGWADKDDWRGDPDQWVDAKTFLERGENNIPILKSQLRKLEVQNKEIKETLKEFAKHHKEVSEREYKRALENIRKQKADAVSTGDSDAYQQAEAHEEKLKEYRPEEIKIPDEPDEHPDFQTWLSENKWYADDFTARSVADAIAQQLSTQRPDLQGREFFDAVKERVKKELPNKFQNPRRNGAAAVEGSGAVRRTGKKSYSDLPREAKAACDRFVKQGLMKQEDYVKEFFGDEK